MPLTRESFIKQYTELHNKKHYGYTSESLLYLLLPYIKEIEPKSILDYGCGQSQLTEKLSQELDPEKKNGLTIYKYDPAITQYESLPEKQVDLVICTDVLEHIPCADLEQVIKKIMEIGENAIFVISTKKAIEVLPDGTNAHCSVYHCTWWLDFIKQYVDFAKLVPWPVNARCAIVTWDSKAVGGKFDAIVKYLAGKTDNFFKK